MALADLASTPPTPAPSPPDPYALEAEMMAQQQQDEPQSGDTQAQPEKEDPVARLMRWGDPTKAINIAMELSEVQLSMIATRVLDETQIDEKSRTDWLKQGKDAMDMCLQKTKAKNSPWPGCSNVIFPLITQAADQFAARAYPAIIANRNVVKGVVSGDDDGTPETDQQTGQPVIDPTTQQPVWAVAPGEKAKQAQRIGDHMSWQLVEPALAPR